MSTDVYVGVINNGVGPNIPWPIRKGGRPILMEPTWLYGGKPYTYIVSKPGDKPVFNIVPLEVAYFHWAVELDPVSGELRRSKWPKEDDEDSWFDNRLSGLCPKIEVLRYPEDTFDATHNPRYRTNDPAFEDWYTNGVTFKMKKISTRMTAEEFMR